MRGYVMEREQDFDNEIEIDLKDLFLEIISYWQWIILVTNSNRCSGICDKQIYDYTYV